MIHCHFNCNLKALTQAVNYGLELFPESNHCLKHGVTATSSANFRPIVPGGIVACSGVDCQMNNMNNRGRNFDFRT
jgi:hypothetical protein